MFAGAFIVLLMAAIFVALPVGLALFAARQPQSAQRWPEGWVAKRRVHRASHAAYRSMPIESVERRRTVPAGMPRLAAGVAGLCAMLAFLWLIACVCTLGAVAGAACHGHLVYPLIFSGAVCLARATSGLALVGAAFARRPRAVATWLGVAIALDAMVARNALRISDSARDDAHVAWLGLALSALLAVSFAVGCARWRGLRVEAIAPR